MKVVLEMRRLIIFVYAEERDVQIVTRVGEVIGVTAKKSDAELRRKDQAHIDVFLVLVQVVNRAGVERHDVAAQAG